LQHGATTLLAEAGDGFDSNGSAVADKIKIWPFCCELQTTVPAWMVARLFSID
jgi:hypothetical protein